MSLVKQLYSTKEDKILNIEEIMDKVGDKQFYQKRQIAFIWLMFICLSFNFFLVPATTYPPLFTKNNQMCTEDDCGCDKDSVISGSKYQSAAAEFALFCDQRELRNVLQSIGMVGAGVGLLFINYFSDNYSRKKTIITAWIIGSVCSIGYALTPYVSILIICNFGIGLGMNVLLVLFLVQINELSAVYRVMGITVAYAISSFGQILIYFIYMITENWRQQILYFLGIPSSILCLLSFFIIEDQPRFLIIKDSQKCIQILNKIAQINNTQEEMKYIQVKEQINPEQQSGKKQLRKYTYLDLFIYKSQLKIVLPLTTAMFFLNTLYYGSQLSLDSVGFSFQQNCLYIGISELIGYFLSNYICSRFKRKTYGIITLFITSVFLILDGVFEVPPSCQGGECYQKSLQMVFTCLARFIVSFSFSFILIQIGEAYPTTLKSTGYGFSTGFSFLGGVISPYIIDASNKNDFSPIISLALVGMVGCVSLLFSQETFGQADIQDIPELIKGQEQKQTETANNLQSEQYATKANIQ